MIYYIIVYCCNVFERNPVNGIGLKHLFGCNPQNGTCSNTCLDTILKMKLDLNTCLDVILKMESDSNTCLDAILKMKLDSNTCLNVIP